MTIDLERVCFFFHVSFKKSFSLPLPRMERENTGRLPRPRSLRVGSPQGRSGPRGIESHRTHGSAVRGEERAKGLRQDLEVRFGAEPFHTSDTSRSRSR